MGFEWFEAFNQKWMFPSFYAPPTKATVAAVARVKRRVRQILLAVDGGYEGGAGAEVPWREGQQVFLLRES
jgi:hypothetical protein